MRNLPKGIHANFTTECVKCRGEIVYRDGRQERHECQPPDDPIARLKAAFDATFND